MIDIDYAGSPLVADYAEAAAAELAPHPGQRYPDWTRFGGTSHHALVFGANSCTDSLTQLDGRWSKCLEVYRDPDVDPARAGIPGGGLVLIRPDGHIGFRASSVDPGALAALDRHLASYLI
jgi:hypothetical protein